MEVTYALGEQMLLLTKVAKTKEDARAKLAEAVRSGAALKKFGAMIAAQGGDARVIDDVGRLPKAKLAEPFLAVRGGFVTDVDAMGVALAALRLGAGRKKVDDRIDPAVGVSGLRKIGERVAQGAPLCVVHANDERALADAKEMLAKAIVVGEEAPKAMKLIDAVL
jgi:pyrimidine-nucleoside phosphorylase